MAAWVDLDGVQRSERRVRQGMRPNHVWQDDGRAPDPEFYDVGTGQRLFPFPWRADFLLPLDGGERPQCRPATGDAGNEWRGLEHQIVPLVMASRGAAIHHGGAVSIGGRAAVFLGASGRGKSTLVTALTRRGHHFPSDDLLQLNFDGAGPRSCCPRRRISASGRTSSIRWARAWIRRAGWRASASPSSTWARVPCPSPPGLCPTGPCLRAGTVWGCGPCRAPAPVARFRGVGCQTVRAGREPRREPVPAFQMGRSAGGLGSGGTPRYPRRYETLVEIAETIEMDVARD